jgi:hypothetical protein
MFIAMSEEAQGRKLELGRLWVALTVLAVLLLVLIVPPLVSVSRYKNQITHLMSLSLGRPVQLGSVELRLLPRPGFVLTDLIVAEDPAYGSEPVLHANTVTAYFRLLSLWRGRLEIGTVSVDEASLNLVRMGPGRWNLDPLFRTAAAKAQPAGAGSRRVPLPYLEATNSRIDIKSGAEKLPFSLLNTDLSFWQESPGDWRIRLRGVPVRTDLPIEGSDTGVVELEASMRQAPELRQMPLHLEMEWRKAQLGELTRLIFGADPGWRGDLTGEVHLDGTADSAQIKTRLQATGVHRAEFAPAVPLDFDANCGFVYRFSARAMEKLECDSPLGNGRVHLAGDLPGEGGLPHLSVELDRIPVQAGLDALRTVRSGLGPGLVAGGTVSGKITFAGSASGDSEQTGLAAAGAGTSRSRMVQAGKAPAVAQGPLTGSFTVEGFRLSGDRLTQPIQVPKLLLEPVAGAGGKQTGQSQPAGLAATVAIPAGGSLPLTLVSRLSIHGYSLAVRGQASIARARELAHVAGMEDSSALDALAGEPLAIDLSAEGPWLPVERIPISAALPAGTAQARAGPQATAQDALSPATDSLSGTVTLHNANWKADYLANHVQIAQATLHLGNGDTRWDPVVFTFGPVKGTASLTLPSGCVAPQPCLPRFEVQFGELDAGTLQEAILGAREPGTLLSELIDRLRPSSAPAWPQLEGTVKADSLILGPVTLEDPSATLRILDDGAEITGLDADLLGGHVHGGGTLHTGEKPSYTLSGQFEKLSPVEVGQLVGLRWSGGAFDADGKIDLSGFTAKDLAASAKGTVHFEWRHGAVAAEGGSAPAALTRFDRWTGDAEIANGGVQLKQSQVEQGGRRHAVEGTLSFGDPPKVAFGAARETVAKKR